MTHSEFHILFDRLYSPLCNYANKVLSDADEAEDVVQGIMVDFWNKTDKSSIEGSLDNYLIRAVKFKCIDQIRKKQVKRKYESEVIHTSEIIEENSDFNDVPNLADTLQIVIDQLPEKTREVFILCKQEGKSYKEIAEIQGISIKTVENQMGRAFRHLRENLQHYKNMALVLIFGIGIGVLFF